jgi:hypothetical protein
MNDTEKSELIQWAQDHYHSLCGVSGGIKAIWHPVVRREMRRLRASQMRRFKEIVLAQAVTPIYPKGGK